MAGLHVFTTNRLELLGEALAHLLRQPLHDCFTSESIIVQSRGMERWLSMTLATHNGIVGNCVYHFPNAFLDQLFQSLLTARAPDDSFHPQNLTFRIMRLLPSLMHDPDFSELNAYLRDDPHLLKLYQLAGNLADLFDQYLVFRPDMIRNWEAGRHADDRIHRWQAKLWQAVVQGTHRRHRAHLHQVLIDTLNRGAFEIDDLPARVSVFGISYMPPFYVEILAALARHTRVNLFLMNPCREFWADIVSKREGGRIARRFEQQTGQAIESTADQLHLEQGNRLLASMGKLGRDFFAVINELASLPFGFQADEQFEPPDAATMLAQVQTDILSLTEPDNAQVPSRVFTPDDRSIQVHNCHSPLREIEVLYDRLLDMFASDPTLKPCDVLIMAPDIEVYVPYIQAVFDTPDAAAPRLPYSVADQSLHAGGNISQSFLLLLDLKNSRMEAPQILALMAAPGIKERYAFMANDLQLIEKWVAALNIRWGVDKQMRSALDLPATGENTWEAGLQRLLLGYAMTGLDRKMFAGILPYDPIEGNQTHTLGRLIDFLTNLFALQRELGKKQTCRQWQKMLSRTLTTFIETGETNQREVLALKELFENLATRTEQAGFTGAIGIDIVRAYLDKHLTGQTYGAGFLTAGITFCALLPMRSIPFTVIGLIGMNNDVFPREPRTLGFDLIGQAPRPGDRSRRDDDRYLFLEALISARRIFYMSFVGQSIEDNSLIPPSVLVDELIDYLQDGYGVETGAIMTLHRLQAFSGYYFQPDSNLFSYSQVNLQAAQGLGQSRPAEPLLTQPLSAPVTDADTVDFRELQAFLRHPIRFFLNRRLGVNPVRPSSVMDHREPFELDSLAQYHLNQNLLAHKMDGEDLDALSRVQRTKGALPHGSFGKVIYDQLSADVTAFADALARFGAVRRSGDLQVDLKPGDFRLAGRLKGIGVPGDIQIRYRYARTRAQDLLDAWIAHLVYTGMAGPRQTILICRDMAWRYNVVKKPNKLLAALLDVYIDGLTLPCQFFPASAFAFAQTLHLHNKSVDTAMKAARKVWLGTGWGKVPAESEDECYQICFPEPPPLDDTFIFLADQIFEPLLLHTEKINLDYD